MRKRKEAHRQSPMAQLFQEGELGLWLLPGAVIEAQQVGDRLKALGMDDGVVIGSKGALLAFALWDHPEIEWELTEDPDAVLRMDGDDLVRVATAAAAELYSTRTTRLGMDANVVALLAFRAANTWLPSMAEALKRRAAEEAAKGEAEPRQSGPLESGDVSTS